LRAPAIKGLLQSGALQFSLLFDQRDMASITSLRSLGSSSWLGDLDSNQGCPVQSREFHR
jgi:hypothetical protein